MISVLICTYNRCETLRATLASLGRMELPLGFDWELIVVDNNSSDRTREVVEEFAQSSGVAVRYVFEHQQGLSYARNTAIRHARGEIVAFTDDDVVLDKSWLAEISTAFQRHDCDGIAGRVVAVWPGDKPSWFQETGPYASAKAVIAFDLGGEACPVTKPPCGANWALRKALFAVSGLFRTDLGRTGSKSDALLGGEDIEFYLRATRDAKAKMMYWPGAVVYHPVTKERTQKSYFVSWCFNGGRSQIRLEGIPSWAVCYFGVPRYYLRSFASNLLKWLTRLEPTRRFYYKQQTYMYAGLVSEARKMRRPVTVAAGHSLNGERV